MSATAANLIERALPPQSGLRQWVSTFPFSWRRRLAQDGVLLGSLARLAVETVLAFYARRAAQRGAPGAMSGAITAVQRTSSAAVARRGALRAGASGRAGTPIGVGAGAAPGMRVPEDAG